MTAPSRLFFDKTHHKSVYNIQPISNIPSVTAHGILSYQRAAALEHASIAMPEVQSKRDNMAIPNGKPLHAYANAYFDPRNPMMYKRQQEAESLCVLAVSATVLDLPGVIVSDGNAASGYSRFYTPEEGIQRLDFSSVYSEWWTSGDWLEQQRRKRIKCAEILVPDVIPFAYVVGAIAVSEQGKEALRSRGFQGDIVISPKVFFRKEDDR